MDNVFVYNDQQSLINEAAQRFSVLASEAFDDKGRFTIALAGGSTPVPLYQQLAEQTEFDSLPWNQIDFFWGDERMVPPDHPESNFASANQALLKPRNIPADNIFRMKGELDPEQAAITYQSLLSAQFQTSPPQFDLILLGMGTDGHTASLFPHTEPVTNPKSGIWVAPVYVPELESWRLTFTPELINAAKEILILVKGTSKATVLKSVLEGKHRPALFPIQQITPSDGNLSWLVDSQAAGKLKQP